MNDKESMVLPKARILVVDDETSIRELCVRILGRTYEVSPAPDGPTAISMARAQTPDLLLTDIRMPGMTGLEAARQIVAEAPDVSVVVMTGFSEFDNLLETVKLGVNGFLMKPFTPDDLRKGVVEGGPGGPVQSRRPGGSDSRRRGSDAVGPAAVRRPRRGRRHRAAVHDGVRGLRPRRVAGDRGPGLERDREDPVVPAATPVVLEHRLRTGRDRRPARPSNARTFQPGGPVRAGDRLPDGAECRSPRGFEDGRPAP